MATALDWTGIAELAERPVDQLSGGQRQRAWISMALAQGTDLLLLDEPTTFLDLAHSAQGQAYTPLWVGPGLSNGLNLVAEFGCPSIAGARFLSPPE